MEALTELHRVLDLLRGEHETDAGVPSSDGDVDVDAPQPTLDLVDDLLSGVRGAGLDVSAAAPGPLVPANGLGDRPPLRLTTHPAGPPLSAWLRWRVLPPPLPVLGP